MLANFQFGANPNPATGMGPDLPEHECVLRAIIKTVEDKPKDDGSAINCVITVQIDPSEGYNSTVRKTLRYPTGADDKIMPFWAGLFGICNGFQNAQQAKLALTNQQANVDPCTFLPGKPVYLHFTPRDQAAGRQYSDVAFIFPETYNTEKAEEMKAKAAAAAGGALPTAAATAVVVQPAAVVVQPAAAAVAQPVTVQSANPFGAGPAIPTSGANPFGAMGGGAGGPPPAAATNPFGSMVAGLGGAR